MSRPVILSPREAALDLLRVYVHRGDPEEYTRVSRMGRWGDAYRCEVKGPKVEVSWLNGETLSPPAVFSLHSLYEELQAEVTGQPVQAALL